jgi:tetratricopeptide (TPR) repeat protein
MPETTYSFAAVAKILDIPEAKLRYWAQVGFVGPSVRLTNKVLFSFQDLISVKAAKELVDRGFAVARIRKALDSVRSSLPHVDRPLDRMRVAFDGDALVVIDEGAAFEVTGQKVFDFGLGDLAAQAAAGPVVVAPTPAGPVVVVDDAEADGRARPATAYEWFTEAMRLEMDPTRLDDAQAYYRKALALDAGLAAAHTNLGQIAYRKGDAAAARQAFEAALAIDPDQPEARFNLANLILESGDPELAVAELRRVLQTAPDFADAHYNLAVALERLGGRAQARAHLQRYLGLEIDPATPWASQARVLIERLAD